MTDEEEYVTRLNALEREVETLRKEIATVTNRDLPLWKGTIRGIADGDINTVDDFPDAGKAFNARVADHGNRLNAVEDRLAELGTVGQEQTSKEEKFAALLTFAQNKHSGNTKVSLTPHEIWGCVGVSRRYACDLIEAMAAEVAGVSIREPTQIQTESGTEHKQKALLVDCDQVQVSPGM